jgi:hypothetical protein
MQPSELSFCIHSGDNAYHEDSEWNIITFCPVDYWAEHECLPDYAFSDQIDESFLPEGYAWYIFVEETQWASKKSKEEIVNDLTKIGFVENKEMEYFLTDCWQ